MREKQGPLDSRISQLRAKIVAKRVASQIKGQRDIYRAVDRNGQTLDFMLSEHRDEAAALSFLAQTISSNGLPRACAIDKSGANTAGLKGMNAALRKVGSDR